MRGVYVHRIWQADPNIYAPPRYRRACAYDAFVPEPVVGLSINLPGDVAGVVSEAEKAIADLNHAAGPELMPLARLLLRTESIASSKVEGMQLDARNLARAEANQETGRKVGPGAAEILANIDAMQLLDRTSRQRHGLRPRDLEDIHRVLLERAPNPTIAGRLRDTQNWIGGNDYNPCQAAFVPPPPDESVGCWTTSAASSTTRPSPRSSRPPSPTPSSRRSTPSTTGTAERDARSCRSYCADAGWPQHSCPRSAWSSPRTKIATCGD